MKRDDLALLCGIALLACGLGIHLVYAYLIGDPPEDLLAHIRAGILTAWYTRIVPGPAPYIVCLLLLPVRSTRILAIGGMAGSLWGDILAFYLAFMGPKLYSTLLIPIFMPKLNLYVLMPLGMIIAVATRASIRKARRQKEGEKEGEAR
jgi:hypothetical protein